MVAALPGSRLSYVEFKRQAIHVVPEENTVLDDMMSPSYWAHVAQKLKPHDIIEVHAEDGSWFATLYVRSAGRNYATVALIHRVDFDGAILSQPNFNDGFSIEWKGPSNKWSVIRVSDKQYIKRQCETKEEATTYLIDYKKAMGQ